MQNPDGRPGEFDFIAWVRAQTPPHARVIAGVGDDCAVLAPPTRPQVMTTDTLMDGTDFILSEAGADAVGGKAMAVNLSDVAAMAAVPTAAVVSLCLPQGPDTFALAQDLFRGLNRVASQFNVPIVGGDTNTWPGKLVVTVTVLGECTPRGPVLRSGARPGDWLFVTGPLGGSIRGRHLMPTSRVTEALALHEFCELRAMADVSDGLAADLGHVLDASGCGAELDAALIPIHPDAVAHAATTGHPALEHALGDGEDFELVFAVSPADGARLRASAPVPVWKVGECVAAGLWLRDAGGARPLARTGWAHGFGG